MPVPSAPPEPSATRSSPPRDDDPPLSPAEAVGCATTGCYSFPCRSWCSTSGGTRAQRPMGVGAPQVDEQRLVAPHLPCLRDQGIEEATLGAAQAHLFAVDRGDALLGVVKAALQGVRMPWVLRPARSRIQPDARRRAGICGNPRAASLPRGGRRDCRTLPTKERTCPSTSIAARPSTCTSTRLPITLPCSWSTSRCRGPATCAGRSPPR